MKTTTETTFFCCRSKTSNYFALESFKVQRIQVYLKCSVSFIIFITRMVSSVNVMLGITDFSILLILCSGISVKISLVKVVIKFFFYVRYMLIDNIYSMEIIIQSYNVTLKKYFSLEGLEKEKKFCIGISKICIMFQKVKEAGGQISSIDENIKKGQKMLILPLAV